jgi:hypothetical protein
MSNTTIADYAFLSDRHSAAYEARKCTKPWLTPRLALVATS